MASGNKVTRGGNPTANVRATKRVSDANKTRTRMQTMAERGAGMNIDRGAKDRNGTSLSNLAQMYTRGQSQFAVSGTPQYRLGRMVRYTNPEKRYDSSKRTVEQFRQPEKMGNKRTYSTKIGTVEGVGTTKRRKYGITSLSTNAQPTDSGNGNSPPVVGVGKAKTFTGTHYRNGVATRARIRT